MDLPDIRISLPDWVTTIRADDLSFETTESRMAFVIELSRQNVLHRTGGPFGAAIFNKRSGSLVSIGVNRVVPLNNCLLHAEVLAIMMADAELASYSLSGIDAEVYEIVTSCEPCAMCIGAILWSGVKSVVCGASGEDARAVHFDEGPVFELSYEYLERRGISIQRDVMSDEARSVLQLYRDSNGLIYNG